MSQLHRPMSRQRDPPPSLFLHPSPSASHVSVNQPSGAPSSGPSSLMRDRPNLERSASNRSNRSGTVISPDPQRPVRPLIAAESTRSTDRTDALWAEMQATLEEVELSASGGTHVFGPDHDRKLADLRVAQIALARAWARSEADDAIETGGLASTVVGDEVRNMRSAGAIDGTDAAKSTAGSGSVPRPDSSGGGAEGLSAKLEVETEADIMLARRRREANDRYFQRVNQGVIDVVTKLDDVAVAMRAVEQESKEVWSESNSITEPGRL